MFKYYYNSFRGFSNEADIISVDQENATEVQQFAEFFKHYEHSNNSSWDLHQIKAKTAHGLIRLNRATKRTYERAGMNLHCNPVGPTEIITATEFLAGWTEFLAGWYE